MAKEPFEAKIIVESKADGTKEIAIHDPSTGRTIKTNHNVKSAEVEREVEKVAETMKRSGNRVTYREV